MILFLLACAKIAPSDTAFIVPTDPVHSCVEPQDVLEVSGTGPVSTSETNYVIRIKNFTDSRLLSYVKLCKAASPLECKVDTKEIGPNTHSYLTWTLNTSGEIMNISAGASTNLDINGLETIMNDPEHCWDGCEHHVIPQRLFVSVDVEFFDCE